MVVPIKKCVAVWLFAVKRSYRAGEAGVGPSSNEMPYMPSGASDTSYVSKQCATGKGKKK